MTRPERKEIPVLPALAAVDLNHLALQHAFEIMKVLRYLVRLAGRVVWMALN